MEAVGEGRDQVAELVRGGGEAPEQQQLRARRVARLTVEDVQSVDLGCPVADHLELPSEVSSADKRSASGRTRFLPRCVRFHSLEDADQAWVISSRRWNRRERRVGRAG